jgi:hypothetical protein
MADVLTRVGRFAPRDVHVLLDPRPADILQTLDSIGQTARTEESLLVFYYSGHSDGQSVFPHGEAMPLSELRSRIDHIGARVRIGILDTCRGGSWTQAKGLSVGPPLDPIDLMTLGTEGTALVSSSSGFENAHEADAVQGSFFTHHLAAGLLGAADRTADGSITLQEAFEYARALTIRDSARLAPTPQHPSFELSLRGRQDIVLAQLSSTPSGLDVTQSKGPLEVIQLSSGVAVVEIPAGDHRVRVALPPGRYLVRKVADGKTYSKEIEIPAGASAAVEEGQLELSATERLALKGEEESRPLPTAEQSTLARNWWELRLAAGISSGPARMWGPGLYDTGTVNPSDTSIQRSFAASGGLTYAITDRLQWAVPVPAFAYRFGDPGRWEIVPRLGLTSIGYSSIEGIIGTVDAGVAARVWTNSAQSVLAAAYGSSRFEGNPTVGTGAPTTWDVSTSLGYLWTVRSTVSLHVGALLEGEFGGSTPLDRPATIVIGSVQSIGYRSLPLVAVHLSQRFSIDAYASWAMNIRTADVRDRYLAGFTWTF